MTDLTLLAAQWDELVQWIAWNHLGDHLARRIYAAIRGKGTWAVVEVELDHDELEEVRRAVADWVMQDFPRRFVVEPGKAANDC